MENVNCKSGHGYGPWSYENNKEVSRICDKCGYKEILPATIEVLEEIKKQINTSKQRKKDNEIAIKLINAFATLSTNDINLIGYLNTTLRDTFSFLGSSMNKEIKETLLIKLKEIKSYSNLSKENIDFISNFITSIKDYNIGMFYDVYYDFYEHNEDLINNFQTVLGYGK